MVLQGLYPVPILRALLLCRFTSLVFLERAVACHESRAAKKVGPPLHDEDQIVAQIYSLVVHN